MDDIISKWLVLFSMFILKLVTKSFSMTTVDLFISFHLPEIEPKITHAQVTLRKDSGQKNKVGEEWGKMPGKTVFSEKKNPREILIQPGSTGNV